MCKDYQLENPTGTNASRKRWRQRKCALLLLLVPPVGAQKCAEEALNNNKIADDAKGVNPTDELLFLKQHKNHDDRCTVEVVGVGDDSFCSSSSSGISLVDSSSVDDDEVSSESENKKKKTKKTVRFADTCGHPLVNWRLFVVVDDTDSEEKKLELSLRIVIEKRRQRQSQAQAFWFLNFQQPANDRNRFRGLLQTQGIALHRVLIVQPNSSSSITARDRLVGIVMIDENHFTANGKQHISRVFIRFTVDHRQSWSEQTAQRLSPGRFQFSVELSRSKRGFDNKMCVEFVVGMQTWVNDDDVSTEESDGTEDQKNIQYHWDNNGGQNFALFLINKFAESF